MRINGVVRRKVLAERFGNWSWVLLVLCAEWALIGIFSGFIDSDWSKYFLACSAVCAGMQWIIYTRNLKVQNSTFKVFGLIFLLCACTILQILFTPNLVGELGRSSHSYLISVTVNNVCWLLAGCAIASTSWRTSWRASLTLLALVTVPVLMSLHGGLVIDYSMYDDNTQYGHANHLLVNDVAAYVLLAAFAVAPKRLRYFVFFATLPVLFAIGGRADLGLYVLTAVIYWWWTGSTSSRSSYVLLSLLALGAAVVALPESIFSHSEVAHMSFASGLNGDSSYAERMEFLKTDLPALPQQAPFGDISAIIAAHNSVGAYIHNFLSVWQFYGVLTFFVTGFAMLKYLLRGRKLAIRGGGGATEVFAIILIVYGVLGMILAKAISFPVMWISLGIWMSISRKPNSQVASVGVA